MVEVTLWAARTSSMVVRAFNTRAEALTYCEWHNNASSFEDPAKVEPFVYINASVNERAVSTSVLKLLEDCELED
jgi:hypothetical protein